MKKIAYSIFAAILVMTATLKASAQSEENRSVSGFNSVASAGPFDVHVKINGTESLKISGNAEVLKDIETTVENGTLKIKFKRGYNWEHENVGKIDVYVTAKSLTALVSAGSGSVKVDGVVSGENVTVTLSGSGEIASAVKSDELHATISGSGSIHLNGNAGEAKIIISGSGEVQGKELKTGSTSVIITGSGSAYFHADKSISAKIIGSGNVIYTGSATVSTTTIGSGKVSKGE